MYDKKERTQNVKKYGLKLREDLFNALGANLVSLLRTGSRVRGEATEKSDYDVSLIVGTIDSSVIEKIRRVFSNYPDFSAYVLVNTNWKRCHELSCCNSCTPTCSAAI